MIDLNSLTIEEKARLAQALAKAPEQLAELEAARLEQARQDRQRLQAEEAAKELTARLSDYAGHKEQVSEKMGAWIAASLELVKSLDELGSEANSVFELAQGWALSALQSGLERPPVASSLHEQVNALAAEAVKQRAGSFYLMNFSVAADGQAKHLLDCLGEHCQHFTKNGRFSIWVNERQF